MSVKLHIRTWLPGVLLSLVSLAVPAAEITVSVLDAEGNAVSNAVVYISKVNGNTPTSGPMQVEVDQIDEMFVPHVRAATIGSSVAFPNSDHVRHHVYSFSDTRTFELPLYSGIPAEPVLFDKAGIVTLGCNIHDHMLGYILILDSPWLVEITNGAGNLNSIPEGDLSLELWHPLLADDNDITRQIRVSKDDRITVEFVLNLKPEPMLRRAPRRTSKRY